MALDKLTKVQSVGISSFIQVVGVVTATGGFVGDLTGNVTGNITGTTSNASGATGDFSIADKIVHTGDTNTALRFPAADTFTVETGGSERFKVTDSLKEVKNGNLRITSTFIEFSGDVTTPAAAAALYRPADNTLAFSTGNNERLRITSTGNVGIKTTLPNNTLTVGDTIQPSYAPSSAGNYIEIARTSGADAGLLINKNTGQWLVGIDNSDGSNAPLRFEYGAAGSSHPGFGAGALGMIIKHNGDIGIGTDNPTKALHLAQNSDIAIRMDSNNANANARTWEIVVGGNASNNAEMVFRTRQDDGTGGSECARIKRNGVIALPSGGGIDFAATSNSSGTMSSELLDDYEEGSWTPVFRFTGGDVGITYSHQVGLYTRVGRLVTCYCVLILSNKGSSTGNAYVQGLPYTATDLLAGSSLEGGGHAIYQDNTVGTHVGPIQLAVINNQAYFDLYRITSTNPGHSDVVTNGNVANNSSYRFVLQYTAV